jgi:hypothetical protein
MTDLDGVPVLSPLELAQAGYDRVFNEALQHNLAVQAVTRELEAAEETGDIALVAQSLAALALAEGLQIAAHIMTAQSLTRLEHLRSRAEKETRTTPVSSTVVSPDNKPPETVITKHTNESKSLQQPAKAAAAPKNSDQSVTVPTTNPTPPVATGHSKPPKPTSAAPTRRSSPKQRSTKTPTKIKQPDRRTNMLFSHDYAPTSPSRPSPSLHRSLFDHLMGYSDKSSVRPFDRRQLQATWDAVNAREDKPSDFEQRFRDIQESSRDTSL